VTSGNRGVGSYKYRKRQYAGRRRSQAVQYQRHHRSRYGNRLGRALKNGPGLRRARCDAKNTGREAGQ
jgi:hypothetical protein